MATPTPVGQPPRSSASAASHRRAASPCLVALLAGPLASLLPAPTQPARVSPLAGDALYSARDHIQLAEHIAAVSAQLIVDDRRPEGVASLELVFPILREGLMRAGLERASGVSYRGAVLWAEIALLLAAASPLPSAARGWIEQAAANCAAVLDVGGTGDAVLDGRALAIRGVLCVLGDHCDDAQGWMVRFLEVASHAELAVWRSVVVRLTVMYPQISRLRISHPSLFPSTAAQSAG